MSARRALELYKKKEKNLTAIERVLSQYGDAWVWCSFDPRTKVLPAWVVGKRTRKNARQLVEKVKACSDGHIPFFSSDELKHYQNALLQAYGIREPNPQGPRGRGRPRKPRLLPPPDLRYAQVIKHRRKGRVIKITTRVIFGKEEEVMELLRSSPVSHSINISLVERNNLSLRQSSRRLTRKTNGFSKEMDKLYNQLCLALAYYHFVKEHRGLRLRSNDSKRKWQPRTPAMAANITNHIWSTRELATCRIPNRIPKGTSIKLGH